MKTYIAGPITGVPNYEVAFREAEMTLLMKGHRVMNPAVLPEGFTHAEYMHICYAMLDVCDAIHMLPGWQDSPGAKMEFIYATNHGKVVLG